MHDNLSRRHFLSVSGLAVTAGAVPGMAAAAYDIAADAFPYEITRSPADWRERLSPLEFHILRQGGTEEPKSSPLWNETRPGRYACRGCDLPLYDGKWKTVQEAGWVFFAQSEPNALLMGIDRPEDDGTVGPMALDSLAMVEVHCRRCGSHQGHIVSMDDTVLHCINGASLVYTPDS